MLRRISETSLYNTDIPAVVRATVVGGLCDAVAISSAVVVGSAVVDTTIYKSIY